MTARVGDPLVDVLWLAAALGAQPPPTVLDVRWRLAGPPARPEHEASHVPGAVFVDLETDLAAPVRADRVGGRHPLPDPELFGAAMRRAGVRDDRTVVVVDDGDGAAAARAWWLLRHHGHDDVRILEGGWRAWIEAGAPVTDRPSRPAPGTWQPGPGCLPVLDADSAAALATSGGLLVDVRVPGRFRGEVEPVDPVAGHVPGAVNLPAERFVGADGRWATTHEVRALLVEPVSSEGAPVGAYCGSGVTAAVVVVALARAGRDAALYAGSWSDWVSDPARPVATGAGSGAGT